MTSKDYLISEIELIVLNVPFHPRCLKVKEIRCPGWSVVELCRVTTASGIQGIGETLPNYTWCRSGEESFNRVKGRNIFDFLWDDSLGAGLQMALFDAAGKLLEVPCHRLMGTQYRDTCPISWWAQDMEPEGWAIEAKEAELQGFTSMKMKARPWFDIEAQMEAVCSAVSPHFKLDLDFNGLLLGVDQAAPLIGRLEERFRNLAIVESPIPQQDIAGNAMLRRKIRSPIAMHIGSPPVMTALKEAVCDGFVIGGGANTVVRDGILAEKAGLPFWLQMVGTGLTTTFSLHLGAVLEQARWPAISCINIYTHPLLKGFSVKGGHVQVPQGPGLGIELEEDVIEQCRVTPKFIKKPQRQIHTIKWPDGRKTHYPDGNYRQLFLEGKLPGFLPGISLERQLDDGSSAFEQEYQARFFESTEKD